MMELCNSHVISTDQPVHKTGKTGKIMMKYTIFSKHELTAGRFRYGSLGISVVQGHGWAI
jgi:hypothetical protein